MNNTLPFSNESLGLQYINSPQGMRQSPTKTSNPHYTRSIILTSQLILLRKT